MCSHNDQELPTLPLLAAPYSDEGLHGYLQRLAEINIYGSPYWITDIAGIPASTRKTDYVFLYRHLSTLSKVTGRTEDELARMAYQGGALNNKNYARGFGGEFLSVAAIEYKRQKVCPQCLLEKTYLRQIWDISLLTACPVHGCELVQECPECHTQLSPGRPSMTMCGNPKCGYDLLMAEPKKVSAEEHAMACLVTNSLKAEHSEIYKDIAFPEVITVKPFMVLEDLIGLLGNLRKDGLSLTGPKLHRSSMGDRRDILCRTAEVLKDWPQNWHRLIEEVRQQNGIDAKGLQSAFGDLYLHLYAKRRDGSCEFLRDEFEAYLKEAGFAMNLVRRGGSRLLEVGCVDVPYLTAVEARKEIGCTKQKLSWLLETGELEEITVEEDNRNVHRITQVSVDLYKQRQERDVLGVDDMCEILGLSRTIALRLLQKRVVPATRGFGTKGHEPWCINREDILQYQEQINAHGVYDSGQITEKVFAYPAAVRKLASAQIVFEGLAEAMASGNVRPISNSQGPARVRDMVFFKAELDQLVLGR